MKAVVIANSISRVCARVKDGREIDESLFRPASSRLRKALLKFLVFESNSDAGAEFHKIIIKSFK
jgi:hypothetical protein